MDNKQKGNLAIASAIKHFVSVGYTVSIPLSDTAKYDLIVERDGTFLAVQCKYAGYEGNPGIYTVNVGRESSWAKWERYFLPSTGDICSPTEESVGENSSKSVKPLEDGNAEPNPSSGVGVET